MLTNQRNAGAAEASEPGVTKLVGSIIDDIQELFKNQMDLFRQEIKEDVRKTKEAGAFLAVGSLILLLGGIFLGLTLVYFLSWMFPSLPLWGAFAIVGGGMAAVGVVFYLVGREKFASFNPLPDKSVEALKENLQWTNSK